MLKKMIYGIAIGLTIVGCSTTQDPTQKPPGFLPNYSVLKELPNTQDGVKAYMYKNPKFNRSDYHAVMVAPVVLYQPESGIKVTKAQIESARLDIESDIKTTLATKVPVVSKPGHGVIKLNIAITGAVLEGDGFSPRYLIPISGVIKLASMATGLDNKTPVLAIETKATDSVTGEILAASVTTINGEKFRMEGSTPEEFRKLAKMWVQKGIKRAFQNQESQ